MCCEAKRSVSETAQWSLMIPWLSTLWCLTRDLDLTRLPPRDSTLDGRWTRKPFGLSRVQPIYLRYMSILFLNILTLLAPTQSADNLFQSFNVLCENENVLISNLHCFFANVTPCPLVLLSSLTVKKIFLSIFSYPFNILNTSI